MSVIVADASVAVKWFLPGAEGFHVDQAVALLTGVREGKYELVEPAHWFAEVASVLVRLAPETVDEDLRDLDALASTVLDTLSLYRSAARLAARLKHNLFDTLYHAAALSLSGATLVTADDRYYRKAREVGRIQRLADFILRE
jgi:predicted nucleic acid-binding protein